MKHFISLTVLLGVIGITLGCSEDMGVNPARSLTSAKDTHGIIKPLTSYEIGEKDTYDLPVVMGVEFSALLESYRILVYEKKIASGIINEHNASFQNSKFTTDDPLVISSLYNSICGEMPDIDLFRLDIGFYHLENTANRVEGGSVGAGGRPNPREKGDPEPAEMSWGRIKSLFLKDNR
ncbi:MAG: hypothetical protein KAY24_14540 [Candidatus Eisenbacteria sp.]|nr:hypothetical protein [Candidatus Eisenbacteria bacterium]